MKYLLYFILYYYKVDIIVYSLKKSLVIKIKLLLLLYNYYQSTVLIPIKVSIIYKIKHS